MTPKITRAHGSGCGAAAGPGDRAAGSRWSSVRAGRSSASAAVELSGRASSWATPAARSVRCSRSSGRPRPASACRSPAACAACSSPKCTAGPARQSSTTAPVICRNAPTGGPPLWYWPVECRNRGPQPNVTGRPVAPASSRPDLGDGRVAEPVQVRHHGQVPVRARPAEQPRRARRPLWTRRPAAGRRTPRSRPSTNAGVSARQRRAARMPVGVLLALGHVGLVERVDRRAAARRTRWPPPRPGTARPSGPLTATSGATPPPGRPRPASAPPTVTVSTSAPVGARAGRASPPRRAGCPRRPCRSTRR